MKLVAIARTPARPDEAAAALAHAAGMTMAEARMRLAPEPPVLVARLESIEADALVTALHQVGLAALAVDARVPSDDDRTIAHACAFSGAGVTFTPRFGEATEVSWPDVLAILRGQRASRFEVERTERSKGFSVSTAVVSGGLKMTRTSVKTVRSSDESTEQVILVYVRDGRAVLLAEKALDFSCLGAAMQPSSTGNMAELAQRLRASAREAFYDERLLRLGRRPLPFVATGELRSRATAVTKTWTDMGSSLDVLAEVMRQAVTSRLLP
jgi:hypothetical protein